MEKEEIKEKLDKLNKEYSLKEKEIANSQEYLKLQRKWNYLDRKIEKLYEKESDIEFDIYDKFLDDESKNPRYTNTENNSRNIRKEILTSIKRGSGIKNLSLLKSKDIEKIVTKLIDKELSENIELNEIKKERYTKDAEREKVGKERRRLRGELNPLENEIGELNRKRWEIERREEKAKEMNDPKKRDYLKIQKRKDEAEKKLSNDFSSILEKVRLEVTKEKILINLEDEE